MLGAPIPATCPKCGSHETARVEWGFIAASHGIWLSKMDAVLVVVGGHNRPEQAPDWVCVVCQPGWHKVHRLALREEVAQRKMEESVLAADFVAAGRWRDRRLNIQKHLAELIAPLLRTEG